LTPSHVWPANLPLCGSCMEGVDANFSFAGGTMSGAAYYKSPNDLYLYFDPDCGGQGEKPPGWILDVDEPSTKAASDLDSDGICNFLAYTPGTACSLPDKRQLWEMFCDGAWHSGVALTLGGTCETTTSSTTTAIALSTAKPARVTTTHRPTTAPRTTSRLRTTSRTTFAPEDIHHDEVPVAPHNDLPPTAPPATMEDDAHDDLTTTAPPTTVEDADDSPGVAHNDLPPTVPPATEEDGEDPIIYHDPNEGDEEAETPAPPPPRDLSPTPSPPDLGLKPRVPTDYSKVPWWIWGIMSSVGAAAQQEALKNAPPGEQPP